MIAKQHKIAVLRAGLDIDYCMAMQAVGLAVADPRPRKSYDGGKTYYPQTWDEIADLPALEWRLIHGGRADLAALEKHDKRVVADLAAARDQELRDNETIAALRVELGEVALVLETQDRQITALRAERDEDRLESEVNGSLRRNLLARIAALEAALRALWPSDDDDEAASAVPPTPEGRT
jgi:hypothetical protein